MKEKILELSKKFWDAMEHADEAGMREIADPSCMFTHIGITCGLDEEILFYTTKRFEPTGVAFHSQEVREYGSTAVVLSDCDYTLLIDGEETTHHFMVTEVYVAEKLVQFSFTALVY